MNSAKTPPGVFLFQITCEGAKKSIIECSINWHNFP